MSQTTITTGGTYSGTYINSTVNGPALLISTSSLVTIENSIIHSVGDLIDFGSQQNVKLIIRNCVFLGLEPIVAGIPHGRTVTGSYIDRLVFENNNVENTGGIYFVFQGAGISEIRIRYNYFKNANGWHKDRVSSSIRQFIQLNKVRNIPDGEIAWNHCFNEFETSYVEDCINMFVSSGVVAQNLIIHHNLIDGAYPRTLTEGYTGGGIMCGDGEFDIPVNGPRYIEAYNNVVLRTQNYGVAIATGNDINYHDNIAVSAGRDPITQDVFTESNVGMYVWDYKNHAAGAQGFANNDASNNLSGWINNKTGATRNDYWFPDGTNSGNVNHATSGSVASITTVLEDSYRDQWLVDVVTEGLSIGVTSSAIPTLWAMPAATIKQEEVWADLPNAVFNQSDKINTVWNVNAPNGLIATTDAGLEFTYDPLLDVSGYAAWLHYRAEVREDPISYPELNTTSVYCLRFTVNTMPDPIGAAAVTLFQRFNSDVDGPDLDVILTATGQFGGIDANTVAIQAGAAGVWTTPNIPLLAGTNDLVVIIENKVGGAYKVSLNGATIVESTGDFVPSTVQTGPQFGVYNHGENADDMKVTHSQYAKYDYIIKPDFSLINSAQYPLLVKYRLRAGNRKTGLSFLGKTVIGI